MIQAPIQLKQITIHNNGMFCGGKCVILDRKEDIDAPPNTPINTCVKI